MIDLLCMYLVYESDTSTNIYIKKKNETVESLDTERIEHEEAELCACIRKAKG